jgi:hypothetical protein
LVSDIDEGCEAVLSTPRQRLSGDLAAVFHDRPAEPWVRLLSTGDREHLDRITQATRTGYDVLIAPYWNRIRESFAREWLRRSQEIATRGVGALLGSLPGVLSWDGRVLRTGYPDDRTVRLAGRGIVLLPSYFCWGNPVTWIDPELPPVLVYQACGRYSADQDAAEPAPHIVALLGRTRAECLRALLVPCTTTELAEQVGTSVGAASRQTAVLRASGLIDSIRRGKAVQHNATLLGMALLTDAPTDQ